MFRPALPALLLHQLLGLQGERAVGDPLLLLQPPVIVTTLQQFQQQIDDLALEADERQQALLKTRLQVLRQREDSLDRDLDTDLARDVREVSLEIERSTRELAALKCSTGTLKYSLRQARQVLRAPENYLRLVPWTVRTDDMNRLLADDAQPPYREACFMEASLGREKPRSGVILLGRWPRSACTPPAMRLQDAERYL